MRCVAYLVVRLARRLALPRQTRRLSACWILLITIYKQRLSSQSTGKHYLKKGGGEAGVLAS